VQTIRWADEATTDLVAIIDYIEQRNATAAQNLYATIVQSVESLPLMPYLFRPGRVAGTREQVVHPNYIVVYQVGNDVIDILRVLHSRQEYPYG
jgi:addiction module RelE/StbE family toxin